MMDFFDPKNGAIAALATTVLGYIAKARGNAAKIEKLVSKVDLVLEHMGEVRERVARIEGRLDK